MQFLSVLEWYSLFTLSPICFDSGPGRRKINLTFFENYDIIFLESKKEKKNFPKKGIDKKDFICYNIYRKRKEN